VRPTVGGTGQMFTMKKALRETQTLRTGCSKTKPKILPRSSPLRRRVHAVVRHTQKFCPTTDPIPGGMGWPKFNQLEMFVYLQTQFGEDRCMQFRVIVVTDPHTHPQTHKQDRLQYTALLSLADSVNISVKCQKLH